MEIRLDIICDGVIDNTLSIQNAINTLKENGGGKLIFCENRIYRSGIICLFDNINLHFENNSMLKASDNVEAFNMLGNKSVDVLVNQPTWENCDYSGAPTKFFLYAKSAKNISITGNGIIDGNEEIFYGKVGKYHIDGYFYPRVPMIFFEDCENVIINNITLQRSAFWTTHLVGCRNVDIDGVKIINNLRLANCDGIDPDHCQNVKINNCYIEAADDCIVFKTTSNAKKYGPCMDIEVSNCTLISTSAAIKFGTESVSDFKNIYIHDCKIERSNRGIAFQLRDEGNIENIRFDNIDVQTRMFSPVEWWGKGEPIVITAVKRRIDSTLGYIKNIKFNNFNIKSENGIFIYGNDNINISDIEFNNFNFEIYNESKWEKGIHDLRPSDSYGIMNTGLYYVYNKNSKDLRFKNFKTYNNEGVKIDLNNK